MARLIKRVHYRRGNRRLSPLAILGICLGGAILLALIIGNILNATQDKIPNETEPPSTEDNKEQIPESNSQAPQIQAYPFSIGNSTDALIREDGYAPSAVSISINAPDGSMNYLSSVTQHLGLEHNSAADLKSSMMDLKAVVPYVCGVFYPQIPTTDDADLLYAVAATDGAILREFVSAGGNEILLMDISLDENALPYLADYLKQLKAALGNVPIGISVPMDIASAENSWETLPTLRALSDFMALDLQKVSEDDIETAILNAKYYTAQYGMRPLLSEIQERGISAAETALQSYQILSRNTETLG